MSDITVLQMGDLTHDQNRSVFYANTIPKHLMTNHEHIAKPHKHNFYVCMLFTKGSGKHEIDFNTYDVIPGSVFMMAPGQTHSWVLSEDIDGYIFFHTQEFFDLYYVRETIREYPVFRSVFAPNGFYVSGKELMSISTWFQLMVEEFLQQQWKKNQLLLNLVSLFYIEANRKLLTDETLSMQYNSAYYNHFQAFEDLLEKFFIFEKSAAVYANKLNMTQKHLNRICRTLVNQTTTDIILDRVVLEGKRMLMYTGKSFSEIALDLGYEDYSYFSKVFKKRAGCTPKEFQKRYE
ncbi:helix-turn-helix domain-containing protein [Myroides pelagicus]|uniref:Helix-turn-helix domain-containing protein n=1 Tax=Myroides pelagicus TaxID=270914 RepID=A0A7K1GK25_9FLAO|nr:helix-turn-helix transcriptional regulator [Myroides pelagicus]MEC4112507.1 helix-turn-helix transcriptional regulator [Myroides pelagicus]MTH28574.1 helix-turn-helix domain-containing protein [Myroides pelagicus]